MATPRDIRERAFRLLFELDVQGDRVELRNDDDDGLTAAERDRADALARQAYAHRAEADEAVGLLAPTWPAHRQPAVDRAILRLAHFELASGRAAPSVIINEAVELAKKYSTERSPAFVNAVLDKIHKRTLGEAIEHVEAPAPLQRVDEVEPGGASA